MATQPRSNKKVLDERCFPIRVRYRQLEGGSGSNLATINEWLDNELGRENYSCNGDSQPGREATSYYFLNLTDALGHFRLMTDLGYKLLCIEEDWLRTPWRRQVRREDGGHRTH